MEFKEEELWNLDVTIAEFIEPRIRGLAKMTSGYSGCFDSSEEWQSILTKMADAFALIADRDNLCDDEDTPVIKEGLDLFRKYYFYLWD